MMINAFNMLLYNYQNQIKFNYQNIENNPEKTSKINPFIYQYNSKKKIFFHRIDKIRKSLFKNKSITLNILFVSHNSQKIKRT